MTATIVSMEDLLFLREDSFASLYVDELYVADSASLDFPSPTSEFITNIHPIFKPKTTLKTLESHNLCNQLQSDMSRKRLNTEEEAIFMDMALRTFDDETIFAGNIPLVSESDDFEELPKIEMPAKSDSEKPNGSRSSAKVSSAAKAKKLTAPAFIAAEMSHTSGQGSFSTIELLTLLYFAQENILKPNSYSKIRRLMGGKRSRASIRRKIEKIVAKEVGVTGGLLQKQELRQKTLAIVKERFSRLLHDAENSTSASPKTQQYARRLRAYASENSTVS